jgi:hypothetical protein
MWRIIVHQGRSGCSPIPRLLPQFGRSEERGLGVRLFPDRGNVSIKPRRNSRIDDSAQLAEEARLAIANGRSSVYVSPVSFLEIAIKEAIGKLKVPAALVGSLEACRFAELPLSIAMPPPRATCHRFTKTCLTERSLPRPAWRA